MVDPTWNPWADGRVLALAVASNGDVFAGGEFSNVGGLPRSRLAKLSADSPGLADPDWDPSPNSVVNALQIDGGATILVGGEFSNIGGAAREHIAKLANAGTGLADANWNPSINHRVLALGSGANGAVLAGGDFITVGGQIRLGFSSIDASGAAGVALDTVRPAIVNSLAVQPGGGVIVGGRFSTANGQLRTNLLRLNADGTLDSNWNPSTNGQVDAIVVDGDASVFVGGEFTRVGAVARNYIAKISGSGSGAVDANWNPSSSSWVYALAIEPGNAVYAGGVFRNIGGRARDRIAKLSISGNGDANIAWDPAADNIVTVLTLGPGNSLFAAGPFGNIGGRSVRQLAKLSRSGTGAADPLWTVNVNSWVRAIVVGSNDDVYVASKSCEINGDLFYCPIKLSGSTGAIDANWSPSVDYRVEALAVEASGAVFAGGSFSTMSGLRRSRIAKLSGSGTGEVDPRWNPGTTGVVYAMATSASGVVYVGGQFSTIGGQARSSLAAFPVVIPDGIFANGFQITP